MSEVFIGNFGGRSTCYRFFEDLMLCIKREGVHRQMYACVPEKQDYDECVMNDKKVGMF